MRWAITGDTQFDQQLRYATINSTGLSTRLVDAVRCFEWVVEKAQEEGCDGLIILGDVFDSRTEIDVSVLDQVCRTVAAAAAEMPVKILAGNHDSYLRTPQYTSLQVFGGMADVYDEPAVSEGFAFMPWVEDDAAFRAGVKKLVQHGGAQVLLSHCLVEGAVPTGKGRAIADLMPDHWHRIILGDVHEPISLLDGKIRYCGAPMQWHYGDAGGLRGFLIYDAADSPPVTLVENTESPRFIIVNDADADLSGVRECDFVRVQLEDPADASAKFEEAVAQTQKVESTVVEFDDADPRRAVHSSDSHEEALAAYVEYQGITEKDELVAASLVDLGLELLEQAKL